MSQLTDTEKVQVCGLILADESLPPEWQERLFPGSTKPPEQVKSSIEAPAQTSEPTKLLYTIEEAAKLLSVSVGSVRRFIVVGRLRRVPNFRHVLIAAKELERFAKSLE